MSVVTNVLVLATGDRCAMGDLTDPQTSIPWAGAVRFVDLARGEPGNAWIGPKCPECEVWAAAFNHLDRSFLLQALEQRPWTNPSSVQVLIKGQDDDVFGLWMFRDERLQEIRIPSVTRVGEHREGELHYWGRLESDS